MARYRNIFYEGEWYGLKKGETLEQLLHLGKIEILVPVLSSPETSIDFWVSTPYGLVKRSSYRRSHHRPKQFVERPKFGPGSGKAGGGRTGAHYRSHVKFFPGSTPETCYACQNGLAAAVRSQGKILRVAKGWRVFWTEPSQHEIHDDYEPTPRTDDEPTRRSYTVSADPEEVVI